MADAEQNVSARINDTSLAGRKDIQSEEHSELAEDRDAGLQVQEGCAGAAPARRVDRKGIAQIMNAMTRNVSIVINDDLDGSPNAQTVTFGFDGVTYEIDLGDQNREKLRAAVGPYIEAGRRVSRNGSRSNARRQAGPRIDHALIRAWAKEHGLKVAERGRISAEVMSRYKARQ